MTREKTCRLGCGARRSGVGSRGPGVWRTAISRRALIRRRAGDVSPTMNSAAVSDPPILLWFRQDLRLADNPALAAATASGRPVVPLFILHEACDGRPWGAASLWRLDKSLRALDAELRSRGSRLIQRRGDPSMIVPALAQALGARVMWNRLYGRAAVTCDGDLKRELDAASFNASLLVEPWQVKTGSGGAFQVFTPFWKAAQAVIPQADSFPAPDRVVAPAQWPRSDCLADWRLHPSGPDWSAGLEGTAGEAGGARGLDRLPGRRAGSLRRGPRPAGHRGDLAPVGPSALGRDRAASGAGRRAAGGRGGACRPGAGRQVPRRAGLARVQPPPALSARRAL